MSGINKMDVALLDYGLGNILCIQRAFEYCGANVTVLSKAQSLQNFTHIVLPGVGAFHSGMNNLASIGYIELINRVVEQGKPLMGICLGMQLLFKSSTERGYLQGLSILPGKIIQIPEYNQKNRRVKLPHIGWNKLSVLNHKSSVISGLGENEYVYFDHTYYANISNSNLLAVTEHEEIHLPALVQKNKIVGCQFHPEKSGKVGLKIIQNFLQL